MWAGFPGRDDCRPERSTEMEKRIFLLALVTALLLGSCGLFVTQVYTTDLLIGAWHYSSGWLLESTDDYTFNADGSGSHSWDPWIGDSGEAAITWSADETNHLLAITQSGTTETETYTINHDNMISSNDELIIGEKSFRRRE